MKNRIITISREFGSGGRTIGKKVAEKLGILCYDSELIEKVASESGFNANYIKDAGEYAPGGFLSSAFSHRSSGPNNADYLWTIQYKIITELAEKGPCVIVGRCADYALADYPNVVSVFICADEEVKIQELMKRHNITRDKAKDVMIKTDKQRSGYYNYYSSKRWGSSKSYNLCINSSVVGIDGAVEIIKEFAKKKQEFLKINENA